MTLSGPNACRGSTKDASTYSKPSEIASDSKIFEAYLPSFLALAGHRHRERIVDSERHLAYETDVYMFDN